MNLSQIHGWQDQLKGIERNVKTKYKEGSDFKKAVDFLMDSKLDYKDIRRVAQIVSTAKEMQWPWIIKG